MVSIDSTDMSFTNSGTYWKTGNSECRSSGVARFRHYWATEQQKYVWLLIFKLFLLGFYLARQGGIQQTASELLSQQHQKGDLKFWSSQFGFCGCLKPEESVSGPILNISSLGAFHQRYQFYTEYLNLRVKGSSLQVSQWFLRYILQFHWGTSDAQ